MQTQIEKPIIVTEGDPLIMKSGDIIATNRDIDMVLVKEDGRVEGHGGIIRNTNRTSNKAIIKLDRTKDLGPSIRNRVSRRTKVSDVQLQGSGDEPEAGIGLHLHVESGRNAIQGCTFRDISYLGLHTGILCEAANTGTVAYINSNIHEGIVMDDCVRGIVHRGQQLAQINQNWYRSLHVQAGRKMLSVVDLDEYSKYNYFDGVIWDWHVAPEGTAPIESKGNRNVFDFPGLLSRPDRLNVSKRDEVRGDPTLWFTDMPSGIIPDHWTQIPMIIRAEAEGDTSYTLPNARIGNAMLFNTNPNGNLYLSATPMQRILLDGVLSANGGTVTVPAGWNYIKLESFQMGRWTVTESLGAVSI